MESILGEINSVLGVVGSFFSGRDGSLKVQGQPTQFEYTHVPLAVHVAKETFLALETAGSRVTELDLLFGNYRLILKNLQSGVLAILCTPDINIPLLNVYATLAAKRIDAESKQPQLAQSAEGLQSEDQAESQPPTESPATAADVPTFEPANPRFFEQLTLELARAIGPVASLIVDEEITALQETREAFPKARVADLVQRAGLAIRDESKRARFLQAMSEVIRQY